MKLKNKLIGVIMVIAFLVGCATMNVGQVPWYLDIQNWSSHQKANFFMATWTGEKNNYDLLNTMENKPDNLIKILKAKREILEKSRVPIRVYVQIVGTNNVPDSGTEQEIINWLQQLQQQIIYGG